DLPVSNFGSNPQIGIDSSPIEDLLLRFDISGVAGRVVLAAKLRLYCIDAGGSGGIFKRTSSSGWTESSVNWSTAPAVEGATIATLGATTAGTWYEIDVASLVTGDGLVSLRASGTSTNGTDYSSKEGTAEFAPQLVVTTQGTAAETDPPTQPTNLIATAPSPNRVDLVWDASTDNVGVTGYRVFRNGASIGTSTTAAYADVTVQSNTAYGYYVIADDAAGNSSTPSSTANITTPADTTPPSPPTNLGTAVVSANRVDLTWTASSDNVGVTGYRVFRDGTLIATSGGTSYSDTTTLPNSSYDYHVRAVDAASNISSASNVATAVTPNTLVSTFLPTADATIQAAAPTATGGAGTTVEVDNNPIKHALLKFTVSGVGGRSVTSVKLRVYCTSGSKVGGVFARVANSSWSESTVTWNTAPAAGTTVATLGRVAIGSWYEVDLASFISGDGTYTIRVSSTSSDGAAYSSKEGANAPQLVITSS
ncbi:MAG: DNRLRE domain-containing protein, partial [Candidatus Limnocylindria bacterium]